MKLSNRYLLVGLLSLVFAASCNDWLTEERPNSQTLGDFFISGEAAEMAVNGCYTPLCWEFHNCYFNEWFIGDVVSDDSLSGGQFPSENGDAYDMENFKTVPGNMLLQEFWRTQYIGIARCNEAIRSIGGMSPSYIDETLRTSLIAEAKFLRAFYYFRLVRIFGGVPMPLDPLTSSDRWKMPRETADAVYSQIIRDLEDAEKVLPLRGEYAADDLGRATRGAAHAMLMKVNLYLKNYPEVLKWGKLIIGSGQYDLAPDFHKQFLLSGEWSIESVFEVQYIKEGMSDYQNFQQFGNFTPHMTRTRSEKLCGSVTVSETTGERKYTSTPGWGYNKPSQDLYDEFEEGDPRRDWTIVVPTDDEITTPSIEIHYGNRNLSRKYMWENETNDTDGRFRFDCPMLDGNTPMRCPLNRKEIRYADVLLMYAEAAIESGEELDKAREYIGRVRGRVGLGGVEPTREALRHERRVELAMEGHRWFDLVRWGIAEKTMMDYRAKYSSAAGAATTEGDAMSNFIAGKHELMPIPQEEVRLGGYTQNPGY